MVAQSEVEAWTLDRKTYARLLHGTFIKKRALYSEFLAKISFLQGLSHVGLVQLADALQPDNFAQGGYLIRYGEEGQWFYIIVEGTVEVLGRDGANAVIPVCEFGRGDCVGEMEFLYGHRTVADVRAKTPEVRTAKLNRAHFELCMGPIKELLKSSRQADPVFDYYRARRSVDEGQTCEVCSALVVRVFLGISRVFGILWILLCHGTPWVLWVFEPCCGSRFRVFFDQVSRRSC